MTKRIAVLVRSPDVDRVSEALRAAVGLCLRGDEVEVVLAPADPTAAQDPRVERAVATLRALGRRVIEIDAADVSRDASDALARAVRTADAVEVWT